MEPARKLVMTEEEYLAFDEAAEARHEYVNGEVVAMSGATPEHTLVKDNIGSALGNALGGSPCIALTSGQKVLIEETRLYAYPDVVVVCPPFRRHPSTRSVLLDPTLIVEVLSPSTELYDLSAKFAHYRRCASIRDILFVHPGRRTVEHYRRTAGEAWLLRQLVTGDVLELETPKLAVPVAAFFEKLDLVEAPEP